MNILLLAPLAQQAPPDTGRYMILGMVVVIVLSVGYFASLVMRMRSAQRDIEVLSALQDDAPPAFQPTERPTPLEEKTNHAR